MAHAVDRLTARNLKHLGRKELLQLLQRNREMYNEWIRRSVFERHRFDILAEAVLGYKMCPHHLRALRHQYKHLWSQVLIWRGAGKTTICTIAYSIGSIICDRERKILLASKTADNASDFLREIKTHFETNERLHEIFGNFVGEERWDASAIQVRGRKKPAKEPTVNTVGVGSAVASKHYDEIHGDDLVDEENSRTQYQREKMLDWYYKVLIPCLNPPVAGDPFIGSLNICGTRYHYADLYGHLKDRQPDGSGGEMHDSTLIIPIDQPDGTPTWPEMFSLEAIEKLKRMGVIRFNSQFRCDCEAMKGQIFQYDHCQEVAENDVPSPLQVYMGVDLAISEDEQADMFAIVVLGRYGSGDNAPIYVLAYFEDQLRFPAQVAKIKEFARIWKPIRIGLEVNAYQKAMQQQLQDEAKKPKSPLMNVWPITTLKDKVTRGWNLAKYFEAKRVFFQPGQYSLKEHLVLFPNHRYKDLFDAFDLAMSAMTSRRRKTREEPGLI